jgi:glycosyltransferase involved in cell wall biosynthesis
MACPSCSGKPKPLNNYAVNNWSWETPRFVYASWHKRRTKYAICIPVINEGERIRAQLNRMEAASRLADIVIADGGSTDGSLVHSLLHERNVRALLVKQGHGRLSAQMRMGMAFCLQEGYQGVIFIDGNNKDDPAAIPEFIDRLEQGYDHVQGSRYIPGGVAGNTPLLRHWGITLLHAPLISLAARRRYTDTTNGFRAYSARFLTDPNVSPMRNVFNEYELHYYLAIRAARLRYKIVEVPVAREYPASGSVPTKISLIGGSLLIIKNLLKSVLLLYDPKP